MNQTDTSAELLLIPHHSGVKLIKPEEMIGADDSVQNYCRVGEVLALPSCVYFLNPASSLINLNETSAEVCQYDSIKQAIGKNPSDHNFGDESAYKFAALP